MKISIATPYRENSIVNIARAAAGRSELGCFYTTFYAARWQRAARMLPLFGTRLSQQLGRRAFPGIPAAQVEQAAVLSELIHVAARRVWAQSRPQYAVPLMYRVKSQFDAAVARRLKRVAPPDALVGMYGASLQSFKEVGNARTVKVLNFVNSHPAEHNRYLVELAGLKAPHHEFIPGWVAARVEQELNAADKILVPSSFIAQQLRAHGVDSKRIALLPYGVDLRAFHPAQAPAAKGQSLQCLYVGQMSHRKGMRVLLEAARRCRDLPVVFRLIGPIVSNEVLAVLPDNVHYEGATLPGGVAEAMRQADLFVLPTLEDACALVVLEAMASGLPVITTTNNGSGEIIQSGRDGVIVPAGDATELADAVRQLVEDSELRLKIGRTARQTMQNTRSWDHYGHDVLETIRATRRK